MKTMNKKRPPIFWVFIIAMVLLTLLRYSGSLFGVSTYGETAIVVVGAVVVVGLLFWGYKKFFDE